MEPNEELNNDPLRALWTAYRAACPEPLGGGDFLPQVWFRIETRQSSSLTSAFGSLGRLLSIACAAVCLAVGILNVAADRHAVSPAVTAQSYADALTDDTSPEQTFYTEAIRGKLPADNGRH